MAVIFVSGPARSGKSAFGVRLARECGLEVTYVATAATDAEDSEWNARLARHLRHRPAQWTTVEMAPMTHDAQLALFSGAQPSQCLLVDALGTYMWARIRARIELLEIDYAVLEQRIDREAAELVDAMLSSPARIVVVCEQIGWDVPPSNAAARLFRDGLGRVAQRLARSAERAYLVVAGYAIDLRAAGVSIGDEDGSP
ncbi:MAG TPA: bifunctional adenosylcobinamide kinase/adenosylcobinamide-phosphate guanylyltransferase [Candidatus Baltobacteraceae bacterium]|jgi:adenosylcobinamide kinase/adenosylcobinamide-phosphate guanylyltransferase|nr:bifunctional adenosylcobinamide kinase/adenosylcobinamide-phosphate guanylyltransferase [Candidatus Baltobacteraceae bacterium]